MLSTVSAIEEQMLCCLLGLSTQKALIWNRDFLHYNHLSGIVAEILARHFPGLPPCLCFFWWISLLSFLCEETQPPLSFFFGEFLLHTPANSWKKSFSRNLLQQSRYKERTMVKEQSRDIYVLVWNQMQEIQSFILFLYKKKREVICKNFMYT